MKGRSLLLLALFGVAIGLVAAVWLRRVQRPIRTPAAPAIAASKSADTIVRPAPVPAPETVAPGPEDSSVPEQPAASLTTAVAEPATSDAPPLGDASDRAREWARSDPARAIRWISTAPPGPERDAVLEIVCAEVAQIDAGEAVSLAERFGGGNINLLENMVQQWAERDRGVATAYAEAKPPGDLRNRLLARVALVQARLDPAVAARWVVATIPPGDVQDEAVMSVLNQWMQKDQAAAQAWAESFPPGALRDRALREVHLAPPATQ